MKNMHTIFDKILDLIFLIELLQRTCMQLLTNRIQIVKYSLLTHTDQKKFANIFYMI